MNEQPGSLTQPEGIVSGPRYRTSRNSIPEDHVSHQVGVVVGMAGQVISGRSNLRRSRDQLFNSQGQLGEVGSISVPTETPSSESASK